MASAFKGLHLRRYGLRFGASDVEERKVIGINANATMDLQRPCLTASTLSQEERRFCVARRSGLHAFSQLCLRLRS